MDDYIDKARAEWGRIDPELASEPADIIGRILRIAKVVEMRTDRLLEERGIARSEFDVLSVLLRTGRPMTPGELSAQVLCSAAGMTKRLKKLVDSGMVTRETNPSDGRGALITLTDDARKATVPILRSVLDFEEGLLKPLPTGTRKPLVAQLRTLLRSLEAAAG